jgi:apolipoprotein N-acyltransferase
MVAVSTTSPERVSWIHTITSRARAEAPPLVDWIAALATSLLLILSFPSFEFAPLAWISLVPLLVAIARRPSPGSAFMLGWATGTVFFYGSCHWLTYAMVHYGGLPTILAYFILIPGAIVIGVFPGIVSMALAFMIHRRGAAALLIAPFIWVTLEYARLGITGQLWNAIGYSQAYDPELIAAARWGGVYAVGFLIVLVNSAIAFALLRRTSRAILAGVSVFSIGIFLTAATHFESGPVDSSDQPSLHVIALQPNVPMTLVKSSEEIQQLLERHLSLSTKALSELPDDNLPRLIIWPESPMNFTYASDKSFQEVVTKFAIEQRSSLLFNSLEPAPGDGAYNSAVLINEQGRMISQYDKIRLLPFGEYVPLPRWLPGASLITALVGDFTPGANYTVMPVGNHRAGVFICVEAAYPSIARALTSGGADVLINISNDGYLGPTAVMRQHLANDIFRAVENGRTVFSVTNTGITARIDDHGSVDGETKPFQIDVRHWIINTTPENTFYSKHGDVFVQTCSVLSLLIFVASLIGSRRINRDSR